MTPRRGGPSGSAPPPPAWLASSALPLETIPAGQVLYRVHWSSLDPVFFGPGAGRRPVFRFDSASGLFGVLYAGVQPDGAIAETLLRNPQRRMVSARDVFMRALSELKPSRALRMVALHGQGLQRVGTDNAISTGPYEPCGAWADSLWLHPDRPDGIAYASRHDPGQRCLAIFERPDLAFDVAATRSFSADPGAVAAVLDRYGKSLDP